MVRPTARVLSLLELLQSGGTRTVGDLAERLGVDERTVRRYVQHLLDLDVPIESVRGRYGGYRLARGHRLPPLMFSEDEALAVVLSLTTAGTRDAAHETAQAKLRRVLPAALAQRLDAVLESVSWTSRGTARTPDGETLLPLAAAVRDHQPVRLSYTSADGRHSDRTLHPHALVVHSDHWYVTGTDPDAGDRTLRLDRITNVHTLPGTFDPPAEHDPAERLLHRLATVPYRHHVRLRVHATAAQVRRRLPAGLAVLHENEHWIDVELRVDSLDWLPAVLASLDAPFEIEQPDELRHLVAAFADRLREWAPARPGHSGTRPPPAAPDRGR
ncbi:helix-turn-helix transcriptional regulator [Cryptosporangium sp. NPDC048952]|uniref:helix-turn-helix transcriptional regulator n=1 Tax=Cryptosporangium sp. NPDC048952 TaxID=3363961 RepID=UPI003715FD49